MQLGARILTSVSGVNTFSYGTATEAAEGNAFDFYLQLVDKEQFRADFGFNPGGNRYMPSPGATLSIRVENLDASKAFTRVASNPFAQDTSIWKVAFLTTDPLKGTISLTGTLTEGAVVRTFKMQAVLLVDATSGIC